MKDDTGWMDDNNGMILDDIRIIVDKHRNRIVENTRGVIMQQVETQRNFLLADYRKLGGTI